MKIIHRLAFRCDSRIRAFITELGIPFREDFICVCKINENNARWNKLDAFINISEENRAASGHTIITEFAKKELNAANYLKVSPKWHHGYPEPSDTNEYRELTYNLDEYCTKCGIGKRQKAPFRFKKAPIWGKNNILQLNWIFDEYFVKPEIWHDLFEPFGIDCRPVVLNRTGNILDSVVQLDLTELAELSDLGDAPFNKCDSCGRVKYLPITRGFQPAPKATHSAMFRSNQFFGSGASANRMVMVSHDLFAKAQIADLKGVSFQPCLSL